MTGAILDAVMAKAPSSAGSTVFYGWWVALALSIIVFLSSGIRFTIGPFLKPVSADLGVDRGTFSLVIALSLLLYGAFMPLVGRLVDRMGFARGVHRRRGGDGGILGADRPHDHALGVLPVLRGDRLAGPGRDRARHGLGHARELVRGSGAGSR